MDEKRHLREYDAEKTNYFLELAKKSEYEVCVWGAGHAGKKFGYNYLVNQGISIDYYCDNNSALIGQEITHGIYCCESERLIKNCDKTICFIIIRCDYIYDVYTQLYEQGVKNIVTYNDLTTIDSTIENFFGFMRSKRIAIYTCITNAYDEISEPEVISPDCDYFLISDEKPNKQSIYKFINIDDLLPQQNEFNNPMKNRYCKINPHKIFKEYKYSVYLDGNITVKSCLDSLVANLKRARIGVAGMHYWNCLYDECMRAIINNPIDRECYEKQVKSYWNQGMPMHYGSFLCNVLIREHNNPICVKLMDDWWNEMLAGSKRDEIPFPYVLWKNGYSKEDIYSVCEHPYTNNIYWEYIHEHKKDRWGIMRDNNRN